MGDNARAEHNDKRLEERREKYGDLADKKVDELQQMAADRGIKNARTMKKDELLDKLA